MILKSKGKKGTDFQVMYEEKLMQQQRTDLINETISYYQTTAKLLKDKKLDK